MRLCGARAVHLTGDIWSLTSNRIGADNTRRGQRRGLRIQIVLLGLKAATIYRYRSGMPPP